MSWERDLQVTAPDGESAAAPKPDADAAARELAKLPPLDYEQRRHEEAERLVVRVSVLDEAVAQYRSAESHEPEPESVEAIEPWPDAVSGQEIVEDVRAELLRYVVFPSDADADATTLWCVGTYLMDAWRLWPKLLIQSPEKRCGKSTLMEALEAQVYRALMTSNITAASLFRCIEAWQPSLLIDEADRFLRENQEANGIINAGHTRRTARVIRTVEVNGDHVPQSFSVWGAQIIASIGSQQDTLEDRSIRINLRRRLESETVSELPIDYFEQRQIVRRQLLRWARDSEREIADLEVQVPSCGNDRARNNWTPLFRIAAVLGGPWPERVKAAYLLKETNRDDASETFNVMVLRDIMGFFEEQQAERLQSVDVVAWLNEMEERPWPEWRHGKPISATGLSRLLKPFGIRPRKIRFGSSTLMGYERNPVEAAYARYCQALPSQTGTPEQPTEINGLATSRSGTRSENVPTRDVAKLLKTNECSGVPVQSGAHLPPDDIENFR